MATLLADLRASRLRRSFRRAPWATLAELAARAGYLARGAIYLSIGAIGLLAALDLTPRAKGAVGALEAWGDWPAGQFLLWLVGLGLYGFAGWRALQALFDVDRCGHTAKGWLARAGQAVSGVTYASLAVSVFGLLDAIEDLHEADDQAATRAAVAHALEMPWGEVLVAGVGLFVLAAGIASIVRAFGDHFGRALDCAPETRAWAGPLARFGYFGRGVALLPAGGLMVAAGLHARASEARGVGGALQILEAQPFGGPILGFTALGLVAFGLFAITEGWLRRMSIPEPSP
jgi:hypothetical protein